MESIALTALANASRDDRKAFLTAHWSSLLMLNYEIDPARLHSRLPTGCEIDLFERRCFISVVGFMFTDTRLHGFKIPLHGRFEEVTLRFYVRCKADRQWQRGVVFIKELVPKAAVVAVGRALYNENYHATKMRHELPENGVSRAAGERIAYYWRHDGYWNELSGVVADRAIVPEVGTERWFMTGHDCGYVRTASRTTLEYQVEHIPWAVAPVENAKLSCTTGRLYGEEFADVLNGPPSSAFAAVGSDVAVFPARTVTG
ncbi:MAG: DUF2071 domain-containing protein [Myxococcota bacterium]